MKLQLLLITHDNIGAALLQTVTNTFERLPVPTNTISIDYKTDLEEKLIEIQQLINSATETNDVLIVTDMFGSTPCNLANRLQLNKRTRLVTGVNLPMLIRIMNYPNLSLDALAKKAISGGREGVISCEFT